MTSTFSIGLNAEKWTSSITHIPQYVQERMTDCYQAISSGVMIPINYCKDSLQHIVDIITEVVQKNFRSIKSSLNNALENIYTHRFSLLYFSSMGVVAVHNPNLFMSAACVGAIFSLVVSAITQSSSLDPDLQDPDTQKNLMLTQTSLSCVYTAAQIVNASRWIHTSTEGPIAAGLSGAMLGHLIVTLLKGEVRKITRSST